MKKIVISYTIPTTFIFSTEIISSLKKEGYHITIISSNEIELQEVAKKLSVDYVSVAFTREFSIYKDLVALIQMILVLYKIKPKVVLGATPKAALISMIASRILNVRYRVYHVLGLPYETATGFKKHILVWVEKLTSLCATNILPVSTSLSSVYLSKFHFLKEKMNAIASLTIAGVDIEKFDKNRFSLYNDQIKKEIGIPNGFFVIGFVARLSVDKGIGDFIAFWEQMKLKYDNLVVLMVGDQDERDGFDIKRLNDFFEDENVFHINHTNEVEKYMSVMDVFVLPSYREGFGNVNIEASSMKLPVISYNVTGCKDSVKDGFSGFLVEKNDIEALVLKVSYFIDSPLGIEKFGNQGRKYVEENFTRQKVAHDIVKYLNSLESI